MQKTKIVVASRMRVYTELCIVFYCTICSVYKLQMKLKLKTYKVITKELSGILNYLLCLPMDM